MKKILSISFALMILLTGMNLTVSTHFCNGQFAAARINFTGKPASCGMESAIQKEPSAETRFSRHCCDNKLSVYSIDKTYAPSEFHYNQPVYPVFHEFYVPGEFSLQRIYFSSSYCHNISPPYYFTANTVSINDICIFRI